VLRSAFLLKITQITSIKCAVWKISAPVLYQYFQSDGHSFCPDHKPGERGHGWNAGQKVGCATVPMFFYGYHEKTGRVTYTLMNI